jgi:hypothetical protein
MMGDIQREKSKDPIISEPAYIHATNGTSVRVPATLHVWSNQPACISTLARVDMM